LWFVKDLERESRSTEIIGSLPALKGGRPVTLGEWSSFVINYIKTLLRSGGIVNRNIVIAALKGNLASKQPSPLLENRDPLIRKIPGVFSLETSEICKKTRDKSSQQVLSYKNILIIYLFLCGALENCSLWILLSK
jgi:hypothetical protein